MAFPSLFSRNGRDKARNSSGNVRWIAGVSITASCQRIESAVIGIHGRGTGAPVEIRKTIAFDIPREIADSFNELQNAISKEPKIPAKLAFHVARELACIEEEAIMEVIAESKLTANDILAVGVSDAGLRVRTSDIIAVPGKTSGQLYYQSLCDAPYLAEQTGLNIVDAFPAQDIALQGNGGPLLALPAWIFLKSEMKSRILVDLGRTARLTFLPQSESPFSYQKIRHVDVVPCGTLLDTLVWQLTGGKTAIDTGGRVAVQGCQNASLMSALRAVSETTAHWMPTGLKPEIYIQVADKAAKEGLAHQDILCTVSCFIAEKIANQILSWLKMADYMEPELLVQGSGQRHGLLMNSIRSQLQNRTLTPLVHLGIPVDTFDALCTAMSALLAIDQIPGNLPHLTGSETAKPLGRITPGAMSNWHRLVCEMAATKPASRSLRSAG